MPPAGIAVRQATEVEAVEDEQVRRALQFIRDKGDPRMSVDEVAAGSGCGRRSLDRKFRLLLGMTVHDRIAQRRMEIACRLLRETDLNMAEVADKAGFSTGERFASVFRAHHEMTPRQFRMQRGVPGIHR